MTASELNDLTMAHGSAVAAMPGEHYTFKPLSSTGVIAWT